MNVARFCRSSLQRGWITSEEGRVLEDVFVSNAKQAIYFLGRPQMVEESGNTRTGTKGTVSADSADMLLGLAIEGAGILRISEHVVAEAIEKGQLEPLLQNVQDPEKYPLWGLLPPGRHQAPKVRAFLDFLIERLGSAPWRADSRPDHDRKRRRARRQPNLR